MSLQSLANSVYHDDGIRERVLAMIVKIARDADPVATYGIPAGTQLATIVTENAAYAAQALDDILWDIALSGETAYETAFNAVYDASTNPHPQIGATEATFTDTQVQNSVANNWPT